MLDRKMAGWIGMVLAPGVAVAAIEDGIGRIVSSAQAAVNGVPVPGQGTVMPGNLLTSGPGGSAVVLFRGGSQVNVFENTSVAFKSEPSGVEADLSSGAIAARSLGKETISVETPGYHVGPVQQNKSVYAVAILSDRTTVVSGQVGRVAVTQLASDKRYTVDEGHYVELAESPTDVPAASNAQSDDQDQQSETPPGIFAPRGRLFILAAGIGAGVAAGILIDREILGPGPASPSKP